MLVLSRVDVFGTDDLWWIIIVISQVFNLLFLMVGSRMETTKNLRKSSNLVKFLRCHTSKITEVFRDWEIGKMILLLICIQTMLVLSPYDVEAMYPMQMYGKEGITSNEVLTMNLITEVLSIPYYWLGPLAIDKLSRKTFLITVEAVIVLKAGLHLVNLEVHTLYLAYPNSILHRMINGCGITSLALVMTSEVLPREYVVIGGQLSVGFITLISGLTGATVPFLLSGNLPILLICLTVIGLILLCFVLKLLPSGVDEMPEKKRLLP